MKEQEGPAEEPYWNLDEQIGKVAIAGASNLRRLPARRGSIA